MWRKAWALGKVCVSPEAAASAASSFHLCLYLDPPKQQGSAGSTQGQIQPEEEGHTRSSGVSSEEKGSPRELWWQQLGKGSALRSG